MKTYEVEIKSLLGSRDSAERLKDRLKQAYPDIKLSSHGKQLNHYFNAPIDPRLFREKVIPLIPIGRKAEFDDILNHGQKMSVRTRDADGKVSLVIKASVGDDSSSNGVKRVEFEVLIAKSLADLDRTLLDAGCTYQAKWSREREEYKYDDMHICIDKNAGYGYLAEFEKVISDENKLDTAKKELLSVMESLGVEELLQDRLERMFAYYNANWPDYYGTDRTFTVQ